MASHVEAKLHTFQSLVDALARDVGAIQRYIGGEERYGIWATPLRSEMALAAWSHCDVPRVFYDRAAAEADRDKLAANNEHWRFEVRPLPPGVGAITQEAAGALKWEAHEAVLRELDAARRLNEQTTKLLAEEARAGKVAADALVEAVGRIEQLQAAIDAVNANRSWGVRQVSGPEPGTWCQHTKGERIETDERTARTLAILWNDRARLDHTLDPSEPAGSFEAQEISPPEVVDSAAQSGSAGGEDLMVDMVVGVSADEFFKAHGGPGIVGPEPGGPSRAWTVYLPGHLPCICDTFEDAAEMMREAVAEATKRAKG